MTTQNTYYDKFFGEGGWKYDLVEQDRILRTIIAPLPPWKRDQTIIEVGAGMCHHSELLRKLGMRVTAVEASKSGAAAGKRTYPQLAPGIVCADASKWKPAVEVDHVFVRGMSFFHYELLGVNRYGIDVPAQTERMFTWLRSGGTFLLQIVTDFSGTKKNVDMNRYDDYVGLFERFGKIEHTVDFRGRKLTAKSKPTGGIIIVTRKP